MAKKADGFDEFLASVVATIPEDRRGAVEEALKQDAVRSELEKGYLRQSDFSRAHDQLRTERENFQSTVEEANKRITGWQEWYGNASQEYDTMREENERLKSLGNPDDEHRQVQVQGVSPEDVAKMLDERDRQAIAFADVLTDLKLDYKQRFNERLNTNELIAAATKRGVPLDVAYEAHIKPRVEATQAKDLEEKLKAAREEGAKEALTKHRLPVVSGPLETHVLDMQKNVKTDSNARIDAAVERWNNMSHTA